MGAPRDYLVPAAILLDNPGITKEEFVELLGSVEGVFDYDKYYHTGLEGLAVLLQLRVNDEYLCNDSTVLKKDRDNEQGLPRKYFNLRLSGFGKKEVKNELNRSTVVTERKIETVSEDVIKIERCESFYEIGDSITGYWGYYDYQKQTGLWITGNRFAEVVEVMDRGQEVKGEAEIEEEDFIANQILRVRLNNVSEKIIFFNSIDELYRNYPEYRPENRFDFNQKSGKLLGRKQHSKAKYGWVQKEGKFYLDREAFRYLNPFGIEGYTDLIMTAEAVRVKSWETLEYHVSKYWEYFIAKFFAEHPEVLPRRERAVYDAWMSESAKQLKMTNNELMRMRLLTQFTSNENADYYISELARIKEELEEGEREVREKMKKDKESRILFDSK